jgi:methionyl-tRNA synthetase
MFCVNCGTELPEGSNFCSRCGAKLTPLSTNIDTDSNGECLLVVERKSSFMGMALKFKAYIDGNLVKELSNGETFSLPLKNGKHNLFFECFGMDRTTSYEFVGHSNEVAFCVSFPSFAQGLNGIGGRTLLVNKTRETERGSCLTRETK